VVDPAHVELRRVQRVIESLPAQCRHVFVLRRVHECPIDEIAAEMALSVSTVEKRLGEAVALLAREIAATGEERSPRDQEDPRLAMAALFFARRVDDRSTERQAELEAWLSADPRNAIAFARVTAAWDKAAAQRALTPSPVHDDHRPAAGPAMSRGQDQQ
jgi:hypothetical protein